MGDTGKAKPLASFLGQGFLWLDVGGGMNRRDFLRVVGAIVPVAAFFPQRIEYWASSWTGTTENGDYVISRYPVLTDDEPFYMSQALTDSNVRVVNATN